MNLDHTCIRSQVRYNIWLTVLVNIDVAMVRNKVDDIVRFDVLGEVIVKIPAQIMEDVLK